MANLPHESRRGAGLDRFFHRTTRHGSSPVRLRRPAPPRRRIVHFNVTEHPTAAWTAQQIVDAFPDDTAPRWLLRDRDAIYGEAFRQRVAGMGIGEVLSGPSSPWQNPYAERLIGSIRRDCLNYVVVFGEQHLRRVLTGYCAYYHGSRTHLSLAKDAATPPRVQGVTGGERHA